MGKRLTMENGDVRDGTVAERISRSVATFRRLSRANDEEGNHEAANAYRDAANHLEERMYGEIQTGPDA